METDHKELQLLPSPHNTASSSRAAAAASFWPSDPTSMKFRSDHNSFDHHHHHHHNQGGGGPPSLDLQLSISLRPMTRPPPPNCSARRAKGGDGSKSDGGIEALKWQAAEQIRIAGMEKAYAERVREMTRREMELAQSDFSRARHMWERAREEVEKAEKLKERATRRIDSRCMEITCQACRQTFRPN